MKRLSQKAKKKKGNQKHRPRAIQETFTSRNAYHSNQGSGISETGQHIETNVGKVMA
jgi:hypothetical protein